MRTGLSKGLFAVMAAVLLAAVPLVAAKELYLVGDGWVRARGTGSFSLEGNYELIAQGPARGFGRLTVCDFGGDARIEVDGRGEKEFFPGSPCRNYEGFGSVRVKGSYVVVSFSADSEASLAARGIGVANFFGDGWVDYGK